MAVIFGHSLDSGTRAGLPGSVPGGLGRVFALPRLFQRLASLARLTLLGTGIVLGSYALAALGQNDPLFDQLAAARNVQEADAIIKAQKLTPEEIAGASKARGQTALNTNAMPYSRGTAAIAEMLIDAMWRYHGYEVPAKAPGVNLASTTISMM